jgi:DNA helicase-2/ATP-dependent DNA helicase PcrA
MQEEDYPSYLEPLNPEQRRAVLHTGKPLLILAGAGSGKTRVITTKIAWLIREKGMDPRSILAVTFTNKAAREMAERARQIDGRAGDAMLRTFHSFGAWFLRRNGGLAGLNSGFVIYDDDDAVSLLSTIMGDDSKAEVKQYAYNISRAKDYFLSPDDPLLAKIDSRQKFRRVYACYEERMSQIGNVDFGDLIKKPVEILRSQPEVARRFHERFRVIMVDEYQDANVAQFHLLKELCDAGTYVCVVGDDDQSIYRFRGAEVKNILEFPKRFSDADIIRLERNYRSTSPILKTASSVVSCNRGRLGKTLRAEKGDGLLPVLACLPDQDEEAGFCADRIKNSVIKGEAQWSDWAVLYRTNAQSLGFETLFLRRGIPYRVVGSLKFYEREEIKDALALLSLLANPRDEVAFRRVVNKPVRGIGPVTMDKIIEAAVAKNGVLTETGNIEAELSQKAKKGFIEFIKVMEDAKDLLAFPAQMSNEVNKTKNGAAKKLKSKALSSPEKRLSKKQSDLVSGEGLSVLVTKAVKESGLAEYHKTQDEVMGNNKLNNLQELVNAASDYPQSYEGLLKFLENIELDRSMEDVANANANANEPGNPQNSVTLITCHNTKGLEFKRVIMTGLEQGIFPREDKKDDDLEEERRLFYVGATRAMDELYLTSCAMRRMFGRTTPMQPSLFLNEIDGSCLRVSGGNYSFSAGQQGRQPAVSNAEWRRGQRVFHENYGYGAVMEVRDSEDGPVVRVCFETGKEIRFLSEHQGRAFEKIGDDA